MGGRYVTLNLWIVIAIFVVISHVQVSQQRSAWPKCCIAEGQNY